MSVCKPRWQCRSGTAAVVLTAAAQGTASTQPRVWCMGLGPASLALSAVRLAHTLLACTLTPTRPARLLLPGTWAAPTLTAPCASTTRTRRAQHTTTLTRRTRTTRCCAHAATPTCMWSCSTRQQGSPSQHQAWRCRWAREGRAAEGVGSCAASAGPRCVGGAAAAQWDTQPCDPACCMLSWCCAAAGCH